MKCTKCDTELLDNSNFCPQCGEEIVLESDETKSSSKVRKMSKPLIFSIIGIICLVVVGISLLITQSNSNKIRVPRSLNKSTASILGSDAKLFDECFRAFVEAYNTREEGDGGLLNETEEFDNLKSQLKYIECDSIEKKEIIKKFKNILFLVWFSDDMETIKYSVDSQGNSHQLEKKIPTQEQLEQTEKYIYEMIAMYYK